MWKAIKTFTAGSIFGISSYLLYDKVKVNYTGIPLQQKSLIDQYISNNHLNIPLTLYIAKIYQMLQQKVYHYGLMQTLQGYNFHEVYFNKNQKNQKNHLYLIFNVNQVLCGHQGINHGGISATIVDTISAYLAAYNVKNPVATTSMNIKYLKPVFANKMYIYQTEFLKRQNRNVFLQGKMINMQNGQIALTADIKYKIVRWNSLAKYLILLVLGEDKYSNERDFKIKERKIQDNS